MKVSEFIKILKEKDIHHSIEGNKILIFIKNGDEISMKNDRVTTPQGIHFTLWFLFSQNNVLWI